jgi:hypothetical protein
VKFTFIKLFSPIVQVKNSLDWEVVLAQQADGPAGALVNTVVLFGRKQLMIM